MKRETIHPSNRDHWLYLRKQDITSTEIAALFGVSPYMTAYGLWHAKKGHLDTDFEETERMTWGTRLQDAIASGICQDENWTGRPMDEYIRLPELRIGSSFDWEANGGLLEVKNVDSLAHRDQWLKLDDGSIEAPVHIELQLQHQLMVSGYRTGVIGALIGGNRIQLLHRQADATVHDLIQKKVAAFWSSIDANQEPEMVFPADTDVVSRLYNFADPGSTVNKEGDEEFTELVSEYLRLGREAKDLEDIRDEKKARILMAIGAAEKAFSGAYTVTAGMVAGAHIEYDRKPYRAFRVTQKKGK